MNKSYKKSGIYKIVNIKNGKVYIGSSKNLQTRINGHIYTLNNKKHHSRHLQAAWDKYGSHNFDIKILLYCEIYELERYEQYFIDYYKSSDRSYGYNIKLTAKNTLGSKHSKETREKLKRLKMGLKYSNETKEKVRMALYKRYNTNLDIMPKICELYLSGQTVGKISKKLGISICSITKTLQRNKIYRYKPYKVINNVQDIVLAYYAKQPLLDICEDYNIGRYKLNQLLKEYHIIKRKPLENPFIEYNRIQASKNVARIIYHWC